jgi:hypothetical protein
MVKLSVMLAGLPPYRHEGTEDSPLYNSGPPTSDRGSDRSRMERLRRAVDCSDGCGDGCGVGLGATYLEYGHWMLKEDLVYRSRVSGSRA